MFDAIKNMTMNVQGGSRINPPQTVLPTQTVEKSSDEPASANVFSMEQTRRSEQNQARESQQVTEQMFEELEQDIETMHNVGLKFSKHDETGRTMIKVMNKENNEVIREIPPEEALDLAAKIEEMIGILFDKEV